MDFLTSDRIPDEIRNHLKIKCTSIDCNTLTVNGQEPKRSIAELDDVQLTDLQNEQILRYDSTTDKWVNYTDVSEDKALEDLTDVVIDGNLQPSNVLTYKEINPSVFKWTNATLPVAISQLSGLQDVQFFNLQPDQYLYFEGSINKWTNTTLPAPPVVKENLSELNDVSINLAQDRDSLIWSTTNDKWINTKLILSDVVDITNVTQGDLVVYDGTKWINRYPSEFPVKSFNEEITGSWNFNGDLFNIDTYKIEYSKALSRLITSETLVIFHDNAFTPILTINSGTKGEITVSRNAGLFIADESGLNKFNIEPPETGSTGFTLKPPSLATGVIGKIIATDNLNEVVVNSNGVTQLKLRFGGLSGNLLNDKLTCVLSSGYNAFSGIDYCNLQPPYGCIGFSNEGTPYTFNTPGSINTWMTLTPVTGLCPDSTFYSNPSNGILKSTDTFTWKCEINFTVVCSVDTNGRNLRFQLAINNAVFVVPIIDFWFPAGARYETIHGRYTYNVRGSEVTSGSTNDELSIRCCSSSHTNIPVSISYFNIESKATRLIAKP